MRGQTTGPLRTPWRPFKIEGTPVFTIKLYHNDTDDRREVFHALRFCVERVTFPSGDGRNLEFLDAATNQVK